MRKRRYLSALAVAPVAATLIASQAVTASATVRAPASAMVPAVTAPVFKPLTSAQAAQLSQNTTKPVIVILKDQPAQAAAGTAAARLRADEVTASQQSVVSELTEVHAKALKQFQLVNGLTATVSPGEEARLKTDPLVAQVIPDQAITIPNPMASAQPAASPGARTAATDTTSARTTSLKPNVIPGACPANQTQLAPEGLSLTNTASANPKAATARSLGFTGAGVTVAWIADGTDPDNVNFIRPDGKSVFTDYQDFTGNTAGAPTDGEEGFIDANGIAGQGLHTYNVNGFAAQSYPNACNIRIEGVAPGVNLVGLNIFSEDQGDQLTSTTSDILEAINYAVETDHVNVINESIGTSSFPDLAADAFREFDDAAVRAGVVVSVASGDAGPTSTLSPPSTDPNVISVGASTQFQFYAQTNLTAARYFATKGWLSNNISAVSSGGFDEAGGTVNLVAPGDLSFASCDANTALFGSCVNLLGDPSDIELSGGTSESAPFVSGAAALVIQAYRKTHSGQTPSPALVKEILTSSATDLGAPATEQGAGLLNSYKAVELAESYGKNARTGETLLASSTQLNATGNPGQAKSWKISVTNTGAYTQTIKLSGRATGADQHVQTGSVTLNDATGAQFTDSEGLPNNYQVFHFTVARNQDRLDASIAWPGTASEPAPEVQVSLVDPDGRFAANSATQGLDANFGSVDVEHPLAGTWTGVIFGPTNSSVGGFNGKATWRVATQQFAKFGTVSPSSLVITPGASKSFTFAAATPSSAGDSAGAVALNSNVGGATSIPVTLRSEVPVTTAKPGAFSGVLTGGNGRTGVQAQANFYEFTVPSGVASISASLTLANDPSDVAAALLVSPDGDTLGFGENSLTDPMTGVRESPGTSLTDYALHPQAGTWTLAVQFEEPVQGNEISDPFAGSVAFNATKAAAAGLPHSTATLSGPTTTSVTVTNTGKAPEEVFLDPRLDKQVSYQEATLNGEDTVALPLAVGQPMWNVPTETSSITDSQNATVPADFDLAPLIGDPDLASEQPGTGALCAPAAAVTYTPVGGEVTAGVWTAGPTECGPFKSAAPSGSATSTFTVTTKAFDGTAAGGGVSSPTGAFWYGPAFAPVTIQPGKSASIAVTITPSDYAPGTLVQGNLYVDAYEGGVPALNFFSQSASADEMAALPYEFTAG
ncbi:MAG: S8 family peptidase [Trebonia sp.]